MAEAFYNHYAAGKAEALSAGTQPASHVDQTVVKAMREIGMDISSKRPKALTAEILDSADRVISMGCGVEGVCPATFVPTEDWQLEDPEGKPIEKVREIRDEIDVKVKKVIRESVAKVEVKNVETAI
jgi:protein-tyrosine-phosphatase